MKKKPGIKSHGKKIPSPAKTRESVLFELFVDLAELLKGLGYSQSEISEATERAFSRSDSPNPSRAPMPAKSSSIDDLDVVAAAVYRWHRDKDFLTKNAGPRPLTISGAKQSVEALLSLCDKKAAAKEIAQQMLRAGLLEKATGRRYIPTSICSIPDPLHPLAAARVTHRLRTLIWSIRGNFGPTKHGTLIEREASVRRLPAKHIPAFRDFTRQQGATLIQNVDDWLETRKVNAKRPRAADSFLEAGVHVFAYLGKPSRE
ncbi:MAG: hypothetical protein QM718_11055 [Steroidobacteraceae bacterium]